ncbi:MAG: sortase [Candidatus Shapirobacteria bacterium]|jgi:sortase A
MAYIYLKKSQPPKRSTQQFPFRRLLALTLFISGAGFLFSAIFPLVSFQIEYASRFHQVVNPLSASFYNRQGVVLGQSEDFTQLSSWFVSPSTTSPSFDSGSPQNYRLSIPKLKVQDAQVLVGSNDLKKSLIQYPETALPGQLGNTVIFGHSVLPQFFNSKSYLTIFSTLYRLKIGDEIFVNYDTVGYKYLVSEIYEVQPTDLSVLEQRFDNRYLTLITCSPPGTYLRRLIIKTQIADN